MKKEILTREIVNKLGLDKVSVITADMLDGYTSIGKCAFQGCTSLTYVKIPNSVTSIEFYAFYKCNGLTSIEIPNSVTCIGDRAFQGCSSLTSIEIPNSVTCIGDRAFYGCSGLTSVTIPNSVISIGDRAFSVCSGLTSVTVGDKTYEKQIPFAGKCKAYKAFNADMTCRGFKYEEGKTYKIKGEPKLCECGFHACLNLVDVFAYYSGEIGRDVVFHEVYLEGISEEQHDDSKIVAKKITIGKRIL